MPAVRDDGTAIVQELFERLTSERRCPYCNRVAAPGFRKTGKLETSESIQLRAE